MNLVPLRRRSIFFIPILALTALPPGCSRKTEAGQARLAILRFENLTADPALDWTSRGIAQLISVQLNGAGRLQAIAVGGFDVSSVRESVIAGGVSRLLHGYLYRTGNRLRLHAEIEDAGSRTFVKPAEASGLVASGVLPLVDAIAHQLAPDANPPGTMSDPAYAAYIDGLDARDPESAMLAFSRSVAIDPNFGAPYVSWIEAAVSRQDRATAERVMAMARARGNAIPELDRARLEVEAAQLTSDPAAVSRALLALSRLTPQDAGLLRKLGDIESAAKRYSAAVEFYKKSIALQPEEASLLNLLGYTQFYVGDFDGAERTLREYERLRPNEANPLDSLGDLNFYFGRFAEAEKFYLRTYRKDPAFLQEASLVKAARARLMMGDVSGSGAIMSQYVEARKKSGDAAVQQAQAEWKFLAGARIEAIRSMENLAASLETAETSPQMKQMASFAYSQLAVWRLETGDRARAKEHAAKAVATAVDPGSAAAAAVCRFLAEPEGNAAEWRRRADLMFSNPAQAAVKNLALAYALLFAKEFRDAEPLLRQITAQAPVSPSQNFQVLLAWTLIEIGRYDEAISLLKPTPVPQGAGPAIFESLIFPRIFFLRATAADKKGTRTEAEKNYKLFLTLSGLTPKIYGEEARARQALGAN